MTLTRVEPRVENLKRHTFALAVAQQLKAQTDAMLTKHGKQAGRQVLVSAPRDALAVAVCTARLAAGVVCRILVQRPLRAHGGAEEAATRHVCDQASNAIQRIETQTTS